MDSIAQARALGHVEGRAEALEEIADLHMQIAALHGRIEQILLAREEHTKELLSNVYKELKSTFKRQTENLTPKQAVELCKPCLRRVVEQKDSPTSQLPTTDELKIDEIGVDGENHVEHPLASIPASNSVTTMKSMTNELNEEEIHPLMETKDVPMPPSSIDIIDFTAPSHQTLSISGCGKIGTGHNAYVVYFVQLYDEGEVICEIKRRYSDFVWLLEQLIAAFPHACIPTLPPKNSIRDPSRFNPIFTKKRSRILQRWLQYIHGHITLGTSSFMHSFLHDQVLLDGAVVAPPSPMESTFSRPFRKRTMSHDKRLEQAFKKLQDPLSSMQKQLQTVTKRADAVIKSQQEMSCSIDTFQQHCFQVHAFDWTWEKQSTSPWDGWRVLAPNQMRLHHDIAEIWEKHFMEPFAFQHEQVLPRFDRQVQDVGKDLSPSKLDRICIEWDELQYVHTKLLVEGFIEAAVDSKARHEYIRQEWTRLRAQLTPAIEKNENTDQREEENGDISFTAVDGDEAFTLFGENDAKEAQNLFGGSSSSDDDDMEPLHPQSKDWDHYIEKMRKKQKSKAQALAEQKESASNNENNRKIKKRPQSLNWPVKRSSHLRLDERVKQQHQASTPTIRRSSSTIFSSSEPTIDSAPPQATRTTSLALQTASQNWIEVKPTDGRVYYYHKTTRVTRWTKPDQAVMESIEERLFAQEESTRRRLEERRQWYQEHHKKQEKEAEEAENLEITINTEVSTWAKNKDVIGMLNSLHEIFPYKDMLSCQIIDSNGVSKSAVKKGYMKAVRQLHPDKLLPSEFDLHQRLLGRHLFSILTNAYDKYQSRDI